MELAEKTLREIDRSLSQISPGKAKDIKDTDQLISNIGVVKMEVVAAQQVTIQLRRELLIKQLRKEFQNWNQELELIGKAMVAEI